MIAVLVKNYSKNKSLERLNSQGFCRYIFSGIYKLAETQTIYNRVHQQIVNHLKKLT